MAVPNQRSTKTCDHRNIENPGVPLDRRGDRLIVVVEGNFRSDIACDHVALGLDDLDPFQRRRFHSAIGLDHSTPDTTERRWWGCSPD